MDVITIYLIYGLMLLYMFSIIKVGKLESENKDLRDRIKRNRVWYTDLLKIQRERIQDNKKVD